MASADRATRNVMIRNLTRGQYFLNVDGATAKRARDEKIPGIHLTIPMLVLGPSPKKADSDPDPDITVPMWLWDAAKNYDGVASLKPGTEREPRKRQGAFIAGLMNGNPPDIVVDIKRA